MNRELKNKMVAALAGINETVIRHNGDSIMATAMAVAFYDMVTDQHIGNEILEAFYKETDFFINPGLN